MTFSTLTLLLLIGTLACAQETPPQDTLLRMRIDTVTPPVGSAFVIEKSEGVDSRFLPLIKRLVEEGWSQDWLTSRFTDKRTVYIPRMTTVKPRSKGSSDKSAYAWVNTAESADACKAFITRYDKELRTAEEKYGVDRETIAALLRCETRHGSVTGSYHVFSVYASMALMDQPSNVRKSVDNARDVLKGRKAGEGEIQSEIEWIRNRSTTRAKWAYKELVNLLKIDRSGSVEAMGIYGSWAGAFGWGQFLPSSYLLRAVDGDGDRKIDLYNPADAIHSTANYLDKAGYRIGDNGSRRRAVHNYNNSSAYVESIIGLAERVRKTDDK